MARTATFSLVVVHEHWLEQWPELLAQIDDTLDAPAKWQLAAEIIFLAHNDAQHEVNMGWHPWGQDLLWRPDLQGPKRSHGGQLNVRYRAAWKARWRDQLID